MRLASILLFAAAACCSSSANRAPTSPATQPVATATDSGRAVLYPGGEPRFEGASFNNRCSSDGDCKVGGCSGEICSAEEGVNSACVAYPDQPRGASCGCVQGECVWYRAAAAPSGADAPATAGEGGGEQGMPCKDGKCAAGLTCVSYFGIAGPRGPAFTSCEIRCGLAGSKCPAGQQCITIADGPGQVCRPVQ